MYLAHWFVTSQPRDICIRIEPLSSNAVPLHAPLIPALRTCSRNLCHAQLASNGMNVRGHSGKMTTRGSEHGASKQASDTCDCVGTGPLPTRRMQQQGLKVRLQSDARLPAGCSGQRWHKLVFWSAWVCLPAGCSSPSLSSARLAYPQDAARSC